MNSTPSQKLPFKFELDSKDISAELNSLQPQLWLEHVNTRVYDGNWDVIPLRCMAENVNAHPIMQAFSIEAGCDWADLPILAELPSIQSALKQLQCEVKSVRLMRLAGHAEISPHTDSGLAIEFGEARLHLPLETNDDVDFISDGRRLPMQFGELWYVNADAVHAVYNRSSEARINLVVDCAVNEWLLGLLRPANSLC